MKRRNFLKNSLIVSAGLGLGINSFSANVANKKQQPNIVFVFYDDLGIKDFGCYGSTGYETPNIDKFAKESIMFTNAYASAPVCSPTRASLFTGRAPARLGITTKMHCHENTDYVKLKEEKHPKANTERGVLFPVILKKNGYQTGFVGKWNAGAGKSKTIYGGLDKEITGFDYVYSTILRRNYWAPFGGTGKNTPPTPAWYDCKPGEYLTDHLTDKAMQFLDTTKRDKPFFLYLGHKSPHTPLEAKEEDIKYFEKKMGVTREEARSGKDHVTYYPHIEKALGPRAIRTKQNHPVYAAMIKSIDDNFGRLYNKLDKMGIVDNTIIMIYSDNGGASHGSASAIRKYKNGKLLYPSPGPTSNLPYSGSKSSIYAGGIREPLLVKYLGGVNGNTTSDIPINTPDFYPTFLEIAGIPLMPEQHKDGDSFVNVLKGEKGSVNFERPLYWHHPHYMFYPPTSAIRKGNWSLMKQWYLDKVELYNLKDDFMESTDVSEKYPEKTKELNGLLMHWLEEEVHASRLVPNPKYKNND